MPILTIVDDKQNQIAKIDVETGTRLVNALEQVGILHLCGGNAKCTTCRVKFFEGEPEKHTSAEQELISKKIKTDLSIKGTRLSCQCKIDNDMTVMPIMTLSSTGKEKAGEKPSDIITPEPKWIEGHPIYL